METQQQGYDYSILSEYFPNDAIEQFRESAVNPIIALLNAEFVEGGDKAIAELLHAMPNSDKFTNSGSLRANCQRKYDLVIKNGGISFRGNSIDGTGVTKCLSFKPVNPRLDNEGKTIKYENPPKSISQVLLAQVDIDTWKAISNRCGVKILHDVDINGTWKSEEIGGNEWRDDHETGLNKKYLKWIKNNPQVSIVIGEGAKKTYSGTSAGYVVAGLGGVWNGCTKIDKDKDIKDESNYQLIPDLKTLAIPGRKFVVAFDKDTKPKTIAHVTIAAKRLANLLTAEGCEVTFANWDSEDGKGIDDLIFNKGVGAFVDAIENAGSEIISPNPKTSSENDGDSSASGKPRGSITPLELAKVATYFHTADKVAYADISIEGNRHTYAVRSKGFKLWLMGEHYKANKSGINSQSYQDTLPTLEAIAIFDGETREVNLRTAEHQGKLYLDLGTPDWKAVEIDSTGWRVISEPPVRFWRPDSLLPLPYPVEGGDLDELKDLLNVDGSSWILIVTFLLFCFCPDKTYPVLVLAAHRGSGKTAAAEILKGLIDPGKAGLIKLQGDTLKLAVAATCRHLMVYDNVGHITPDQSDDLCRVATGFGYSTRTLHTTGDETTFEFTRPQIITAIDALVTRDDLADRVLMAQLPEIPEDKRLPQGKLNEKVESARPRILGALLTALSQTLAQLPHTNPDKLPRMADYALFAIASERALGLKEGEFMAIFNESREQSRQVVIESSPVGEAIIRLMENYPIPKSWRGTASELLKELETHTDDATYRSRFFPKAAHSLTRQLNRLSPDLRAMGIDIGSFRKGGIERTRLICIQKEVKIASLASLPSSMSDESSQGKEYRGNATEDTTEDATLIEDTTVLNTVPSTVLPETSKGQGFQEIKDGKDAKDAILPALPVVGVTKKIFEVPADEF
jgi:energy-coupling factor transporter ATP-binding protein EcfA2